MTPSSNTVASGTAGTLAIVVAWISSTYTSHPMPTEVAIAVGVLVSTAAGYLAELIQTKRAEANAKI